MIASCKREREKGMLGVWEREREREWDKKNREEDRKLQRKRGRA